MCFLSYEIINPLNLNNHKILLNIDILKAYKQRDIVPEVVGFSQPEWLPLPAPAKILNDSVVMFSNFPFFYIYRYRHRYI